MSAGGAAARLRALPADATATEVLCAALGCDRRGLASLPGGAARALASMLGEACDREGLLALADELAGARRTWWRAALSMPDGRLRMAVGLVADDYGAVAGRIREACGMTEGR